MATHQPLKLLFLVQVEVTLPNYRSTILPLIKSSSQKAVGQNIKKEIASGKSQKQAVAIALSNQRKYK